MLKLTKEDRLFLKEWGIADEDMPLDDNTVPSTGKPYSIGDITLDDCLKIARRIAAEDAIRLELYDGCESCVAMDDALGNAIATSRFHYAEAERWKGRHGSLRVAIMTTAALSVLAFGLAAYMAVNQ